MNFYQISKVTNCGWLCISFLHIGHERFLIIHSLIHDEWYSCEHDNILTSCPLRYVSRQIEHSEPDSPSDNAGDCDGDKQTVTDEGFLNIFSITKSTFALGSSLIILTDSLRIRWIIVAYLKWK